MIQKLSIMFILVLFIFIGQSAVYAQAPDKGEEGPCKQIKTDCGTNGYKVNEAKEGHGLWWDCMCPLIAPNFPEPKNNALTLPNDQALVPACRQHPAGQKIMARCADMMAKKNAKAASKTGH